MVEINSISEVAADERKIIQHMVNPRQRAENFMHNEYMQIQLEARQALLRNQLEQVLFKAEQSIGKENASRTLSKMYGTFSLVQKLMQSMG